jgi:very-short-patch-repair endonuclease
LNLEFLKKIKQKLQVGNTRSIHLNLFPGRFATRLDLSDLDHIKQDLSQQFLDKLLSQPSFNFKFKIELSENKTSPENTATVSHDPTTQLSKPGSALKDENVKKNLISKRLASIYYENEDTFLEHGIKTFGFGFPTLIYRSKADPEKVINAPAFIWKMDLVREKNEWVLQKDEEFGITINDVLLNFLEGDLNTSGFFSLNDEYLSDSLLDKDELLKIINRLIQQISANTVELTAFADITQIPDKEKRLALLKEGTNPLVSFSGAFGLFRTQKEAIINDIKKLIQNVNELKFGTAEEAENYQHVQYSAVETDPTQEHALKSIKHSNKLVIHGPPGTGKSQTLTAIIVNALFNKAKCLVVCEKRTALEVVQKNLGMLGLGGLSALIEDVNRDRKKIVDAVRDPQMNTAPVGRNILDSIFTEADIHSGKINSNHRFYGRYILNDNTWSDLVGRFLNLKKNESKYEELYAKIKNSGIDFRNDKLSEDYNNRVTSVKRNEKLYRPAKDIISKFKIVNDKLFENNRSSKEIVIELNEYISKSVTELNTVISNAEAHHENYSNALKQHYKEYHNQFSSALQQIHETFEKNTAINRYLFTKIGGFPNLMLGIYSAVSKKYKGLKEDKRKIIDEFSALSQFTSKNYFECAVTPINENITEADSQVILLTQKLDNWYNGIDAFIEKELSEYHIANYNKNAFTDIAQFEKIESDNLRVINELNNSGLFSVKFEFAAKPNLTKITYLKNVRENFSELVKDIDCLYDYTYWRKDYVTYDESGRKIIDSLIEVSSANWELDFELWYLFNLLIANENKIELRDEGLYESLGENISKIKQYQVDIIKDHWRKKQVESAANMEARTGINVNALYNKSRNSRFQKRNSLRRIISADFNLFTDYFPVLLVNPGVCSSLLDMKEGMFDVVIFDEASQLRIEDVYAAKLRGKNKVVAGDENQMPPSSYFASSTLYIDSDGALSDETDDIIDKASEGLADSESLLEFSIRRGYTEAYLDIHYRSKHPDLINFSNAAFYNSRLNPVPPARNYKAMRYFQTYGIYDPAEGINFVEATKVISLIDELVNAENADNNPSIGIATFNIFQRNYVLDLIQQKSEKDTSFAEKINILRNKPGETFFVKNLENIQGDERDIIIISTTFGKKPDGSFLQNFGPINQEKGFRLLNVIVTRAKHLMIVCTSIPEENISEFSTLLPVTGNKGKAVFYAYLAYARSIEKSDLNQRDTILDLLRANREESERITQQFTQSNFEREVIEILSSHISRDRIIQKHEIGGFVIDIAVKPIDPNGKLIAIECDGANYHNSPEAYLWDMFRKSYLEKCGIEFTRIWSVNWWNNQNRELTKLLEIINKYY